MESKIKSIQDACKYLGYEYPKCLPDVTNCPAQDTRYLVNHEELVIIARALNTEYSVNNNLPKIWEPDYNNTNQRKYFVWFEVKANKYKPSGFAFSRTNFNHGDTVTGVAARLLFPTSELALYFATQFEQHHINDKLGIGTIHETIKDEDIIFNKVNNALQGYHANVKDQAKSDFVPSFCINELISEMKKQGLKVVQEDENLNSD